MGLKGLGGMGERLMANVGAELPVDVLGRILGCRTLCFGSTEESCVDGRSPLCGWPFT
ncbi:MAG: hypothetical protein VYA34_15750 [Myxococcota bacterium]|nr:hypothetical protein [Myxococcota bacterium]